MLRRCRLCARTLGAAPPSSSSRSLAIAASANASNNARTENYQQQQQQHQPVASTSKLAYTGDNFGTSSHSTGSTRRRYSSADAAFASDSAAADSEQTSSNNDHRFASTREYGFRRSSPLSPPHYSNGSRWKGKARAVDEHDAGSPPAAATAPPITRESEPETARDIPPLATAHTQVPSGSDSASSSSSLSFPATPAAASTSAPLESDLAADIQSQAHPPNITTAAADETSLLSTFEACLEKKDFIASLHSLVRAYLYRYERDRPDLDNDIGMMAQKLQTGFAGQPRTNALKLLLRTVSTSASTGSSTPSLPSLEMFLQMLFRAVMDQNDYRTWKKALQRVLKRTANLLIRQEGLEVKASNSSLNGSITRLEQCFLAIIGDFRAGRRWESAAQLAQLYVHLRDGAWSAPVLEQYLEANHQLGRPELAPRLHALPTAILPLPERTYGLLLRAHLAARNLEAASAVRQSMQEHGIKPSSTTYNYIFSSYKTLGGSRALLADVEKLGLAYDTDLANALLACAIHQDGLPAALETIGPLFRIGTRQALGQTSLPRPSNTDPSPSVTVPPVPTAASKRSTPSQVPVPTVQSRAGALQGIPTVQPNQATYNLLVRGYADNGNFEAALDLCTEMEEQGFRLSPFVTSALLQAFRPRALATSAIELPALVESTTSEDVEALDQRKPANAKAWNKFRLPQILRKRGLNGFPAMLQEMSKGSFRMYDAWIPMLLHHISSRGVLQPAELADVSVKLRQAHGTAVNMSDFNVLWQSWVEEEQTSSHATQKLVRWDQGTAWHGGLPAFQSNGNGKAKAMNEVLAALLDKGARADPHTVAITMRRHAKAGASPAKLWEFFRWHVLHQGLAPTAHQLAALMTAYVKAGDVYGARRILERGKGLGVRPTLEMYSILITYFTQRQQPSQAYAIMDEMIARKIEPDLHVLTAIAAAYAHRGALAEVKELEAKAYTHDLSEHWPNAAFETLKLRAHVANRDHLQGQLGLKAALDLDLKPDDHLYTFVRNQRSYARNAFNQAAAAQQTRLMEDQGKLLEFMDKNMAIIKARIQEARPDKVASKTELLRSIDQVVESITENRKVAGGILDDYTEVDEKGKSS